MTDNPVAPAPVPTPPGDPIVQRLAHVQKIVQTQQRQLAVSNILTLLIGLFGLCMMGAYMQYGYSEISSVVQPKMLVEAANGLLDKHLPDARRAAQQEIKKSAPQWAARASERARAAIPELRVKLENFVMERMEHQGEQAVSLTQARIKEFIKDNRDELKRSYAELAKNPNSAKAEVAALRTALEKTLGGDMQSRAQDLLASLETMNQQLSELNAGKNLNPEQQVQRRVLMVAKRLQAEQADLASARAAQ